jgi:hypothetical protein
MPPSKLSNSIPSPTIVERIKRTSITNQTLQQPIKKEIPSKTPIHKTTQGLVQMRRESYAGTSPTTKKQISTPLIDVRTIANGKSNSSTKK